MSNLGGYQRITTWSKKVGGPGNLFGIAVGSGVIIGGLIVHIGSELLKKNSSKSDNIINNAVEIEEIFEVTNAGQDASGLTFEVGDSFRIITLDEEVVLIEKIGSNNNPYYLSMDFMEKISLPFSEYLKNESPGDK